MNTISVNDNVKLTQLILKWTFVLLPIIAGLDKFFNILAVWDKYLNPNVLKIIPLSGQTFMMIVGVIEIIAGIIVYFRTKIGAIIVTIWLVCIAINLISTGEFYDIAVRDLVMAISAYCLYRLS